MTLREMRGRESWRAKQAATQVRGRRSWRTPTLRKSTPPQQCLGEAERHTPGEDQEQHGKQRELPLTKELSRKDLGKADQKVPGKLKAKSASKPGKGCWNCGKEGHIQAQCPEQLTKSSKQLLQIDEDSCPRMTFQVNGKGQYQALIDSGASDSFISHSLVSAVDCKTVHRSPPLRRRMTNSQEITSNQQAKVELLQGNHTCKMTCWVMGPEWKDEDIILGVDFLNLYKGCLKFHKDGTIRLDWGEEWGNATNKCGLKQPSLYPIKQLNVEEVRAALRQKVEEADLNQQQKKQLMGLLLCYEDRFVFGLEKLGQSTKNSIELLGNP